MVTGERLRSLLDYDPETGEFRWKRRDGDTVGVVIFNVRYAGQVAGGRTYHPNGSPHDLQIKIDGVWRKAHRLVWLWMTGEWPQHFIDHINHDGHDNRWINLRATTKITNAQNRRGPAAHSRSGIRGVYWDKARRKWATEIKVNGRKVYLGRFKSRAAATLVRRAASQQYFGPFAGDG